MLICGSSNSGKTNLVLNMLCDMMDFDTLTIISPSIYQPKYKLFSELSKKHQEIRTYSTVNDYDIELEDEEKTNVVIFDDLMNDSKSQPSIVNTFSRGRHKNITVFYLTQSYFQVPINVRLNCTHYIFFNTGGEKVISRIFRDIVHEIDYNLFKKIYTEITSEPYSFIYIDKFTTPMEIDGKKFNVPMIRKCFDHFIVIKK